MKAYHRKRADHRRRVINRYKRMKGCTDCGYRDHHAALEFDHVRGTKTRTVASLMYHGWRQIKDEIAKCDVVCSNCHSIRTFARVAKLANAPGSEPDAR